MKQYLYQSLVLLIVFFIASCSILSLLKTSDKSIYFRWIISEGILNYDSILYGKEPGNVFAIKIINNRDDSSELTYSITTVYNKKTLKELKPFYYFELNGDIAIIKGYDLPDSTVLFQSFLTDQDLSNTIKDDFYWIFMEPLPKHQVAFPTIGIYSYRQTKITDSGILRYFIASPVVSVPQKYRPILNYNSDEFLHVDTTGQWFPPVLYKRYFKNHTSLEDMYDHEIKIKFGKRDEINQK